MDSSMKLLQMQWFANSLVNQISDDYEVQTARILGSSTFGKVLKAKHKLTQQYRAIKIIPKMKVKQQERFKKEVEILRNLNYQSFLCKFYEIYEDLRNVYVVMEYCEGEQLFQKLFMSGISTEEQVRKLFKQIVQAINVSHMNGVCHRDLRPESILFLSKADPLTVKIIDFGISQLYIDDMIKKQDNRYISSTRPGQPYFIAPEVLQGKHGFSCDIWAAGVILYIMLTGYPPFQGDTAPDIFDKIQQYDYNLDTTELDEISNDAKDLLKKIFVPSNKRFSAGDILRHQWILKQKPENSFLKMNQETFKMLLKQDHLKKLTLNFISTQLNEKDIGKLQELFIQIDSDEDGEITIKEMKKSLTQVSDSQRDNIQEILKHIDSDDANTLNYLEFMASAIERCLVNQEEQLYQMFKLIDTDCSGKISSQDLMKMFGDNQLINVKQDYVNQLIKQFDTNGDGEVDYMEFIEMIVRKKKI